MGVTNIRLSRASVGTHEAVFKFAQGQKVFCLIDEELFNAHIIDCKSILGGPHYKVHYHGHNKSWDEYVSEDRLRAYSAENIKLAEEMKAKKKKNKLPELQQLESGSSSQNSLLQVTSTEDISVDSKDDQGSAEAAASVPNTKSYTKKGLQRHKSAISNLSSLIKNGDAVDPPLANEVDAYEWQFKIGQKVLCYHGQLLYLSQCINRELRDGKAFYQVHYCGWSQAWDEWMDESQVLPCTDENFKLSKELYAIELQIKNDERNSSAAGGTEVTDLNRKLCAYSVDEKVMCYYGAQLYSARVLNVQLRNDKPHYLLHYVGWNKFWDEWVAEDRVIPENNENILLAEKMRGDKVTAALPENGNKSVPETATKSTAAAAAASAPKRKPSTDKEVVDKKNKKVKKTSNNNNIATSSKSTPKKTRTRKLSKQ